MSAIEQVLLFSRSWPGAGKGWGRRLLTMKRITQVKRGIVGVILVAMASPALAHPMGNFSISHYSRLTTEPGRLQIHYLLDLAEIPTVELLDRDANGRISPEER